MNAERSWVVRGLCLRCTAPLVDLGLPCPNPECPNTVPGPTYRRPVAAPSCSASFTKEPDITRPPVMKEVVFNRMLGWVTNPADWGIPSRRTWVWVEEE